MPGPCRSVISIRTPLFLSARDHAENGKIRISSESFLRTAAFFICLPDGAATRNPLIRPSGIHGILLQEELFKAHILNAALILPGKNILSHDHNFPEKIRTRRSASFSCRLFSSSGMEKADWISQRLLPLFATKSISSWERTSFPFLSR